MKTDKKEADYKELIKVRDRINQLHDLIRSVPQIPLKKKIFAGHWRFFKVRDDVLRSTVGEQAKKVVDACNHWVRGKKKDPDSYSTSTEVYEGSWFYSTKPHYMGGQHLRSISEEEFEKAKFPAFFSKKWFAVYETTKSFGSKNVKVRRYYPKVPKHMLEWAYKAAYIVSEQPLVGDYESELSKLQDFMSVHNGWTRICQKSDHDDYGKEKRKKLDKINLKDALDDV